jgi:hypothetical protein
MTAAKIPSTYDDRHAGGVDGRGDGDEFTACLHKPRRRLGRRSSFTVAHAPTFPTAGRLTTAIEPLALASACGR